MEIEEDDRTGSPGEKTKDGPSGEMQEGLWRVQLMGWGKEQRRD